MKRRCLSAIILLVPVVWPLFAALPSEPSAALLQSGGTTTRVSVASDGTQGYGSSHCPSMSADGRYVAFHSTASNLVPDDTNTHTDIFVHDRQTGQTTHVSVASDRAQGNGTSYCPSISADGRYVAFYSWATNLVTGDTNGESDIFVHDRQTGETTRVHVASDGTEANGYSDETSISADGRYVAFASWASNLLSDDTNGRKDIFVHDRQTGQTTRVSIASDGTQGNFDSWHPSVSANGRYVAFTSSADNLVPGDTYIHPDVFVHDRQTGQTTRVSVASDGTQANGGSGFNGSSISADGRYVAFHSWASNLVPGDTNAGHDVFIHDRQTGQTTRVSIASDGTQANDDSRYVNFPLSYDGRYVAFASRASNLVAGDTNGAQDIFVHDRQTGQTTRVSIASDGTQGNNWSSHVSMSADGRYLAFRSYATNLVPGDTNADPDVFVRDRGMGYGTFLQLPFNPAQQTGPCAFSPNSLNCISSLFDHEYPLLPPVLGGTEPTTPGIGDTIVIFNSNEYNTGGTFPNASDYGYSGHDATDFRLKFGSPVIADAAGTVTVIPNHPGGLVVEIDHGNGYESAYWHLSGVADGIHTGAEITQDDVENKRVVAYSGTAGTGPHLHFAVYFNGKQVDPFGWEGGFEDPWVADYGGPESDCLWNFACSVPTWATSTTGTSLTSPDGSTTVSVPAGAVTDTTLFELTLTPDPVADPSAVPAGYSFDLSAHDIYGSAVETFLQPLTITINYAESIVNYVLENTLTLYYWDDLTQTWQALTTSLDLVNNTATATTDHLSLFALLGEPQNPAPTIASASPNSGYSHLDTQMNIEGTGFLPTPSVRLGIGELAVTFVNSSTLAAVVPSGLDSGTYDLTVTNPDAQEDTLGFAFTVLEPLKVYLPLIFRNY